MADPHFYNDKRAKRDGNYLRVPDKTEEINQTFKHKTQDEFSRVTDQIKKHGNDYLPESFNLYMYKFPNWKSD